MAGQQHRRSQGPDTRQDASGPLRVHTGKRFVQQKQRAPAGQAPGQRQPPAHAAGELGRIPRLLPRQLHQFQPAAGLPPPGLRQHIGDVLPHRAPGQQPVLLKEQAHRSGEGRRPGLRLLQPRQYPQQGGLAAAGGSGQGGDPLLRHCQGKSVQNGLLCKTDGNIRHRYHTRASFPHRRNRKPRAYSSTKLRAMTAAVQAKRAGVSRVILAR